MKTTRSMDTTSSLGTTDNTETTSSMEITSNMETTSDMETTSTMETTNNIETASNMVTTNDDKRVVCAATCDGVACELCEATSYCGDACEEADFMSHRASCKFRERALQMQSTCAVCDQGSSEDGNTIDEGRPAEICTLCYGAKYCSVECKEGNADEHKLLCKDYAGLPLRPTSEDHLHLLSPGNEDKPRFIWISDVNSVDRLVNPETESIYRLNIRMISQISEAVFKDSPPPYDYRDVGVTHADAADHAGCVHPNRSLGMSITGRPLRAMKGNLLLSARFRINPYEEHGDIISGDLAKCLPFSGERRLRMRTRTIQKAAFLNLKSRTELLKYPTLPP